jgi:ketol-acid reductoisomerase
MHKHGITAMRKKISRTAAWGSFVVEDKVISDDVRSAMTAILDAIESGDFARGWQEQTAARQQEDLGKHIDNEAAHPIEQAGRSVRELMPYLKEETS